MALTVKLSKVAANRVGRWNMLLSEFSMAISYLRGEDNHLSDQLSRAVQLPEEAWIQAGPGIDTDDKFEKPFAVAWPELYRQVVELDSDEDGDTVVSAAPERCFKFRHWV